MKITVSVETASPEEAQSVIAKLTGAAPAATNFTPPVNTGAPAPLAGLGGQSNDEEESGVAGTEGQLDKDGLPWDKRIHSSSKKITGTTGKWARRKNVPDEEFNRVVAELRGAGAGMNNPAPAQPQYAAPQQQYAQAPAQPQYVPQQHVPQQPQYAAPQPAPAPVAGVTAPGGIYADIPQHMQPTPHVPVAHPAPAPVAQHVPQAPQPPLAHPAPAPQGGHTFGDLFNKIQSLFAVGTDPSYVVSLQQRLGHQFGVQITSLNDMANRPDIIAAAFQMLAQDGK